jgi:hypothetical protein
VTGGPFLLAEKLLFLWCYANAMSGKNFEGISGKFSLEKLLFKEKFHCLIIAFLEEEKRHLRQW